MINDGNCSGICQKVSGMCLEGLLRMFGMCLVGFWKSQDRMDPNFFHLNNVLVKSEEF